MMRLAPGRGDQPVLFRPLPCGRFPSRWLAPEGDATAGVDIPYPAKTLASIFAYGKKNSWVSHKLAEHWLQILERLHAIFRVPPFGAAEIRAVKKERKHYHLDWTLVPENGPRFENLVACHLAKWVEFEQDVKGRDVELRYFRDDDIVRGLSYLKERFAAADAWQISATGKKDYVTPEGIRVAPALTLLRTLV